MKNSDQPPKIRPSDMKRGELFVKETTEKLIKGEEQRREQGRMIWGVYDSGLERFNAHFTKILSQNSERSIWLEDFFEEKFGPRTGRLIGVELGGPGSNLFRELNRSKKNGIFARSVGVTLNDFRQPGFKAIDQKNNHSVIEGDVFGSGDFSAYRKVEKWLGDEKVDVMMERLLLGMADYIDAGPEFFFTKLKKWYSLLGKGGIYLGEIPSFQIKDGLSGITTKHQIEDWISFLKKEYVGAINADCAFWDDRLFGGLIGTLYLEKIKDTPLPRQRGL